MGDVPVIKMMRAQEINQNQLFSVVGDDALIYMHPLYWFF